QILDLVGRHPFLTLDQLTELLGVGRDRARRLRALLVQQGWTRAVGSDELPQEALGKRAHDIDALGFTELTRAGRRALARTYGLHSVAAGRHQGLIGGERWQSRRLSLMRALAHTLGVNDVFVALAAAARTSTEQGSDEALLEWRSAAACATRHC